ncbi:hypothetical protein ES703_24527 [subsurface metagenome]
MFTFAGKLAVPNRSGRIDGVILQEYGHVGGQMWQWVPGAGSKCPA